MIRSKATETKVTFEDCRRFQLDPTRNPLTGRTIKIGGPIYNKLVVACKKTNLQSLPSQNTTNVLPIPGTPSQPTTPATPATPATLTTPSTPVTLRIPKLPNTPVYTPTIGTRNFLRGWFLGTRLIRFIFIIDTDTTVSIAPI